jgi:hypothetical protein
MGVWKDPVFVISAITLFAGIVKIAFTYLYKSKCDNFSICWGMFNVHRNIQLELEADRIESESSHPHAEV